MREFSVNLLIVYGDEKKSKMNGRKELFEYEFHIRRRRKFYEYFPRGDGSLGIQ